jgi:hypothetical protein
MKTLIVHPDDSSTDFLLPIHDSFESKTVVRADLSKKEILCMMVEHERIIAMGHGTPSGLMSVGQFPIQDFLILDTSFVEVLRSKENNIFIWCYAYEFAKRYDIPCFSTNMFISDQFEAMYMGIKNATSNHIEESNSCFVKEISKCVHMSTKEIYDFMLKSEYANLSKKNTIAAYNFERLHYILSN